jgi:hypothetical protein
MMNEQSLDIQNLVADLRHAAHLIRVVDVNHRRGRFVAALNRHADDIEGGVLDLAVDGAKMMRDLGCESCNKNIAWWIETVLAKETTNS